MANPMGLHIQAQGQGFDRAACIQHVRAADYVTCTALDDLQLTIDLHIPYGVYRSWAWEPQPQKDTQLSGFDAADDAFDELVALRHAHPGSENILFMVNCEQGFGVGVSWMYARLIQRCATEISPPIGLVVGNWASGAVKCGQGDDPNQWISQGEPLLRALEKYGDVRLPSGAYAFIIGVHEYTGIHPWIASNGGADEQLPRWDERPSSIDWTLPQWHLGRFAQGMMAACQHFNIPQYPRMMITECLFDDMADVAGRISPLLLTEGYEKARGWRSLIPQHQIWYPDWDASDGTTYAQLVNWVWQNVYKPLGFIIGMHVYSHMSTGDWESFRVDNAPGYLKAMEAMSDQPNPGPTPPIPDLLGRYNIVPFIWGSGEAYLAKNNWGAAPETMWGEQDGPNLFSLRKNNHREEFGLTAEYIVRGIDDSPGNGEYYVLTNQDGSQGSPWCPRLMKPGDVFRRFPKVTFYSIATGQKLRDFDHLTWLRFVKYHPVWVSADGFSVPYVIELEACHDNGGKPGAVFEKYWEAFNLGLVGWKDIASPKLMGIAARPGNLSKPARMIIPWYKGLKVPDTNFVISPTDSRWKPAKIKSKAAKGTNLRKTPFTTGENLGTLQPTVVYDGKAIEAAYTGTDGKWWAVYVTLGGLTVIAYAREDVVEVTFAAQPPPVLTEVERQEALTIIRDSKTALQDAFSRLNAFEQKLIEGSNGS